MIVIPVQSTVFRIVIKRVYFQWIMLRRYLAGILTCFSFALVGQDTSFIDTKPFTLGESVTLSSQILHEPRIVNIYVPDSYRRDSLKRYPVIYLLDGSANEDFIHIVGLVQFGTFPWVHLLPETIVVGIANVDRIRDFTFPTHNTKDHDAFPTSGGSDTFIRFISEELQPWVDTHYRTDSVKTLIGQSLGGLLATEILFRQPDLFDNYIIISPSLWWDNMSLLLEEPIPYSSNKSIYIGVGLEGQEMESDAQALFNKLNSNKKDNTQLYYHFFEKLRHGDALHLAVYDAFEKMFKKE